MAVDIEGLQNQISRKASGYKSGYFITIDSTCLDGSDRPICRETLYRFSNTQIKAIADEFSIYCFGLRYLFKHNSIKVISTIEIGKDTKRLHAHLMLLQHGQTYRTFEQAEVRLQNICERTINMLGDSAIDIKPFKPKTRWIEYFTKDTQFMMSKYGFMNIDMY